MSAQPRRSRSISHVILLIVGIGFVVFAAIAPMIGFGVRLEGASAARLMTAAIGALLIGIVLAGEKAQTRLRAAFQGTAALVLLIVTIAFVLEWASIILLNVLFLRFPTASSAAERGSLPYYQTVEWGNQYWREHSEAVDYSPYVIWQHVAQTGETINVDEHGIRLTPGADCIDGSYLVFVFGGSTVWGIGVPDWETIPAHLQMILSAAIDQPVCVINYGDMGYVSSQEVLRLSLELQAGHIPAAAVFYDGLNDMYAAFQSGTAGTHQNLEQIRARFDAPAPDPFAIWVSRSALYQVISAFARPGARSSINYQTMGINADQLAQDILRRHAEQREFARRLGELYGFDVLWFWQPLITTTDKPLTDNEWIFMDGLEDPVETLHPVVESHVIADQANGFYDFTHIYDAYEGELWIDGAHVLPDGNRIAAEAIADVLLNTTEGD